MDDLTENFVTKCLLKVHYDAEKIELVYLSMDTIAGKERENAIIERKQQSMQCINTKNM